MKSRSLPLALAGLILVALIVASARRPARPTRTQPDSGAAAHTGGSLPTPPPGGADAAVAGTASASPAIAPTHPTHPAQVRGRIEQAYPSVTTLPSDWREFCRANTTIVVAPYPGAVLTFHRVALKVKNGRTTWQGTNPEIPGASLVAVAGPRGTFTSTLLLPGSSQFAFHTERDGRTLVEEFQPGEEACGLDPHPASREIESAPALAATYAVLPAETSAQLSARTGGEVHAASDPLHVDVLFCYTPQALAYATEKSADPVAYLEGRYQSYLETGNVVLANSQISTFRWRFAGLIAADTTASTSTDITHHLTLMNNTTGTFGRWIAARRREFAADQVVVVHHSTTGPTGIANSSGGNPSPLPHSVLVVAMSYRVLTHELAHNFGCSHDRENAFGAGGAGGNAPAVDGDGKHNYGIMWWLDLPRDPTKPLPNAGTIMSYASQILPNFSNPDVAVQVDAVTTAFPGGHDFGLRVTGIAVGDPRAANNAKTLRDNAPALAATEEEISAAPAITTQPAAQTVTASMTLSLSVSATGGGLTYQWRKDGAALAGATTATYSKIAATTDAGAYSVVVTNRLGSVTSEAATVTISAGTGGGSGAPAPSGGGGGGGGGAPSTVFFAALAVLGVAKRAAMLRRDLSVPAGATLRASARSSAD